MEKRNQTNHERDILDRAARVLPQGSLGNLNYDLIVNKGKGSHIWDESGNEYVDYLLGSGPMLVGHSNPPVLAAVLNQLSSGTTFSRQMKNLLNWQKKLSKLYLAQRKFGF